MTMTHIKFLVCLGLLCVPGCNTVPYQIDRHMKASCRVIGTTSGETISGWTFDISNSEIQADADGKAFIVIDPGSYLGKKEEQIPVGKYLAYLTDGGATFYAKRLK